MSERLLAIVFPHTRGDGQSHLWAALAVAVTAYELQESHTH